MTEIFLGKENSVKTAKQINNGLTGQADIQRTIDNANKADDRQYREWIKLGRPNCQCKVKQPELSQPDSEGWWWFSNKYSPKGELCFVEKGIVYDVVIDSAYTLEVEKFKGIWIKAIVPEFKEEL